MDSIKMDGKALADDILGQLALRVERLRNYDITPCLAVIGSEDDASKVYIRQKKKACERLHIEFQFYPMSEEAYFSDYVELIGKLNSDPNVHGIIVQLPVKSNVYNDPSLGYYVINHIDHCKDVDGLTRHSVSNIWSNETTYFEPCTPRGIVTLLKEYLGDISGKHVVIVGRSNIVGKPLAGLLLREDCTVTICHSKTERLMYHISNADILVTAMGDPNVITELPYGIEALVDVSMNRDEFGHLVGDVPKYLYNHFNYYTPVPGGVGPMTVAMLMENVVDAAENTIL